MGALGVLGGSRGAIASRVGLLASPRSLIGGCGMSRDARELRLMLNEGWHIRVGWRRGRVLHALIVLALHLLELSLLLCSPLLVLGLKELVEDGLDVAPPRQQIVSGQGQIEVDLHLGGVDDGVDLWRGVVSVDVTEATGRGSISWRHSTDLAESKHRGYDLGEAGGEEEADRHNEAASPKSKIRFLKALTKQGPAPGCGVG